MADKDYIYQVARIRAKELTLLSSTFIRTLLTAESVDDCLKLLAEKDWGAKESASIEEMLKAEREKTWKLMREMVEDMTAFDVFLYGNDYHNLKAAMKDAVIKDNPEGIYIDQGTVSVDLIKKAFRENDLSLLPESMQEISKKAYDILLHTGDSQQADVIIDKAALESIYKAAKKADNEFLKMYGELTVACANIKIAIRAVRTGKDKNFLKDSLAKCDSLDIEELASAATQSEEEIRNYLSKTVYSEAVQALDESVSAFEVWCDNYLIKAMKSQLVEPFGLGPLAAYILARENEIKTVRLILAGKQNGLSGKVIDERIREMYV